MQGSSGVSPSTNGVELQTSSNTTSTRWCPNASTIASAGRSHFAPLTAEEKITYRNWRRATLIARASPASYPNPPAAAPLPIGLKDFPATGLALFGTRLGPLPFGVVAEGAGLKHPRRSQR
jgi:hypothetical protein